MGHNTRKRNTQEALRNNFRYLQGVKPLPSLSSEQAPDYFAQRSWPFSTKSDCPEIASQIKEVPLLFFDLSAKPIPIEIFNHSPARQEKLSFDCQACRQKRVLSDEDGPRRVFDWHRSPLKSNGREEPSFLFRDLLGCSGVNPSTVRESNHDGQKSCSDYRNHRRDNGSAEAMKTRGAHQKPARDGAADSHNHIHQRAVAITFKNSSCCPSNQHSDENPCR